MALVFVMDHGSCVVHQLTYTSVASRPEAMAVSAIGYLSEKMQFEFYVILSLIHI